MSISPYQLTCRCNSLGVYESLSNGKCISIPPAAVTGHLKEVSKGKEVSSGSQFQLRLHLWWKELTDCLVQMLAKQL